MKDTASGPLFGVFCECELLLFILSRGPHLTMIWTFTKIMAPFVGGATLQRGAAGGGTARRGPVAATAAPQSRDGLRIDPFTLAIVNDSLLANTRSTRGHVAMMQAGQLPTLVPVRL